MIEFTYHGEPVGKGRPRVTASRGKFAHAYTPKRTKEYEDAIRFEFMASNCEKMPVYDKDTPLIAIMIFAFAVPKSYSKKKREACLRGEISHTHRPDTDNLIKSTLDALVGAAIEEDAAVVKVVAEKIYSEEPYVEVVIDEYKRTERDYR